MSFPLQERVISGYRFGSMTFYTPHHLGVDYRANFVPLFAPFRGLVIYAFNGPEGGKTIWFKPDHDSVIMRFMHLSEFNCKGGDRVEQGQQIAVTGNTGKYTTGPHLHLDISRGSFVLKWPGNFIDPDRYNWDWTPPVVPEPMPVPIKFWVTTRVKANFRKEPTTKSEVMITYPAGTRVECIETVDGEVVTVDGETSGKWYKSKRNGWYISATVAIHN